MLPPLPYFYLSKEKTGLSGVLVLVIGDSIPLLDSSSLCCDSSECLFCPVLGVLDLGKELLLPICPMELVRLCGLNGTLVAGMEYPVNTTVINIR